MQSVTWELPARLERVPFQYGPFLTIIRTFKSRNTEENTMAIIVSIPTPLRSLTGGEEQVQADVATVRAVVDDLEKRHAGIRERLLDDKGVRRHVNLYVGEEDIRFLDG